MVFNKVRISTLLIFLGIFILFFATRLTNLLSLPIFTDEAIYVRWAQIAKQDAAWRFISLTDGKQPSFIWLAMNSMRIVNDPLLASRLVSVFAGFGTLLGVIVLSLELFKKKRTGNIINQLYGQLLESKTVGYIAGLLFVLYPFALVYDRMAMYDSLVACTMVWSMYATVLVVRYIRLDIAIIAGMVFGSAVLTKTSAFFAIYLLPFSLLLFDTKHKNRKVRFIQWVLCAGVAVLIAYGIYSVLRLSPFFYIIEEKNAIFVYPFSEWISHPTYYLQGNFRALVEWAAIYLSIPVILFAAISFLLPGFRKEKFFLLLWFMLPFIALGIFGRTLYPRFIYFMTIPLIVLASCGAYQLMEKFKNRLISSVILLLLIPFYLFTDYFIIFNFPKAPIPQSDLNQYSNSWPAGGGVREMIEFFDNKSRNGNIYVLTQGTFGSLPTYSMEIYLGDNKKIETRGLYPLPELIPDDLKSRAMKMPVYVVLNDSEVPPSNWPITLVEKYQKGIGDRHLSIYKVNP